MPSPLPGVLLVTGAAMLAYGLASGRLKLLEVKGPLALLGGVAAAIWAPRVLPGAIGIGVGVALLVPSAVYCVQQALRGRAESKSRLVARDAALIEQARAENPALALLAQASVQDAQERRSKARWRSLRMGLALPLTLATVGLMRGSLALAAFGAAVGLIPPTGVMIMTRFVTPVIEKKKLEGHP